MKLRNLYFGLKHQLPFNRLFKNYFITGNGRGLFHKSSHIRSGTGKEKISFPTLDSALRASNSMSKKHNKDFSAYKCIYCDGFHIGKNK